MRPDGSPSDLPTSDPGGSDARRAAADAAAIAYWRDVAHQRRAEAARVQRRPLVRAAVAADRTTRHLQDAVGAGARTVGRAGRRARVVAAGWRRRPERAQRRQALDAHRAAQVRPSEDRPVLVVHLGPTPPLPREARVEAVPWRVAAAGPSSDDVRHICSLVRASDAAVVCLLGPTARPEEEGWIDHLTSAVSGRVVASTPLVVHPDRRSVEATSHDVLVRNAGIDLELRPDGVPVARSRHAGGSPQAEDRAHEVTSGTAAAVAVTRQAWLAVDGLRPELAPDLDALVVDLCLRLRRAGGEVVLVPGAVVTDHRDVMARAELTTAVDDGGHGWRAVVEDQGAALVQLATGRDAPTSGADVVVTTATPSRKLADRSGDWLYAGFLADALRRRGHRVRLQSSEEADSLRGRVADLHLVLRGLEPVRRTRGQAHVLWVISHPEALPVEECDEADLVLVASEAFAAHLRTLTSTPVEVLLQATEPRHFRPRPIDPAHRHDVTVVESTRGVARAAVSDALAAGLRPAVYGQGWEGRVDPGLWVAEYAEAALVPVVYSSAGVVLNDHWETMRHWGFVSNRIFDVAACGTAVVSDHLPEVVALFGDLVPTWRDPDELAEVVAALQADPVGTAARSSAARAQVLEAHTFDHRVAELGILLARHGVGPPGLAAP